MYSSQQFEEGLHPGTIVKVNKYTLVIERYLYQGGLSRVYLVTVIDVGKHGNRSIINQNAVLKRLKASDKKALSGMKMEVETMKQLMGNTYIVRYMDSQASIHKKGGYEVLLLMEYCNGGSLINLMNERIYTRFFEDEILHIFRDVVLGVASMHYLRQPLLHRDIKIENVLIAEINGRRQFKLCDFGSTVPPRRHPVSIGEARELQDEIAKKTTVSYRSPEMLNLCHKFPIDEKSDIWALGVFLYKLCYYTTPFQADKKTAVLEGYYTFPDFPQYSDRMMSLIASMLIVDPRDRPNIYQVYSRTCLMMKIPNTMKNIYADSDSSYLSNLAPNMNRPHSLAVEKHRKSMMELPTITPNPVVQTASWSTPNYNKSQPMRVWPTIINPESVCEGGAVWQKNTDKDVNEVTNWLATSNFKKALEPSSKPYSTFKSRYLNANMRIKNNYKPSPPVPPKPLALRSRCIRPQSEPGGVPYC